MHDHSKEGNYLTQLYILSPSSVRHHRLPSAESRRDLVELQLFGYRSIPGTVEAKCLSHSKSIPLSIGLLLFFMLTLRVRAEPIPAICVGT